MNFHFANLVYESVYCWNTHSTSVLCVHDEIWWGEKKATFLRKGQITARFAYFYWTKRRKYVIILSKWLDLSSAKWFLGQNGRDPFQVSKAIAKPLTELKLFYSCWHNIVEHSYSYKMSKNVNKKSHLSTCIAIFCLEKQIFWRKMWILFRSFWLSHIKLLSEYLLGTVHEMNFFPFTRLAPCTVIDSVALKL